MKIKVKEEDFIVEEKANIPFKEGGRFKIYLLEKRGFNTVDCILKISKTCKIPLGKISYGGKKDRYGITKQYVSIEGEKIKEIQEKSFSLKFIGEAERQMGPDLIEGNFFDIKIREIEESKENIERDIEEIKTKGFVNYFDDQRFGSFSKKDGFIAEKIIKKHYNGALKIYLTSIYPGDKREERERKKFFNENWKNWDACLQKAKTKFERIAFRILKNNEPNPFLKAINLIPKEELSLFFSAFQSYLWNKVAEKVIKIYGLGFLSYRGNYWDYLFYKDLNSFEYLKEIQIPTISHNIKYPDDFIKNVYEEILKERELKRNSFNLKKVKKAYFKSSKRSLIVFP
ncbi:MAG: tRNA pseudouridine(13) synthase TruD, partial [Thermoanaerobaculia bacterium]